MTQPRAHWISVIAQVTVSGLVLTAYIISGNSIVPMDLVILSICAQIATGLVVGQLMWVQYDD